MARQYVTKATIKKLFQAKREAHSYTTKLRLATWLLRFIGEAAGLDRWEADAFVQGDKEYIADVINQKVDNQYEGCIIPAHFFDEGKPDFGEPDLLKTSWTHGLCTLTCPDVNALAQYIYGLN